MLSVLVWWLALASLGVGFMPLTLYIFRGFSDRGWIFSKIIGLLVSAWALWCLAVAEILPFDGRCSALIVILLSALNYIVLFIRRKVPGQDAFGGAPFSWKLILSEELTLLFLMLLAMYVIGFDPGAYGTEKYMDYAFLTSMARSTKLPFADPWYAGEPVNYYYGGQYMAAFLMKLTGTNAGIAYNAMRALVTAFSFVLPFSLVCQMVRDRTASAGECRFFPAAGGLLGGLAVAFAGNGHYLVYGLFGQIAASVRGTAYDYWFPDSTRFIGYNPDVPDKTIHEFPSYSSILGDLHAHYVNLVFVIAITAVVYAWAQKREERRLADPGTGGGEGNASFLKEVFCPEVLLTGLFTGVFRWTNAADFAIYYVVCGSILFFVNLGLYRGRFGRFLLVMGGQAAVAFAVGYAAALPFTMTFRPFTEGIHLTHSHSALWQLMILWGFPLVTLAAYILSLVLERRRRAAGAAEAGADGSDESPGGADGSAEAAAGARIAPRLALPDLAALLFGLCAAGLVLLPELVYVKDIYGDDNYRANTMFKLTYQAFILFGIMMGYVLIRGLMARGAAKIAASAGVVILLLMTGYTGSGVQRWFGNIFDLSGRTSPDASVFICDEFPDDYGAVNWLNTEVGGQPVILEAPGDSYSDYCRVSVSTGLPTPAGWFVHEWLWRNGYDGISERTADAEEMYTSRDADRVRELLDKYDVAYIYVGKLEREKYEYLNEPGIRSLGEVVYSEGSGESETYIVKTGGD